MSTTLTAKGQVTIPKKIRDVLDLAPGTAVDFDVEQGRIVICKASEKPSRPIRHRDRFDRVRGRATVKWRTEELMRLLRGDE
ncbi:MAG: type II toxin-antitoxin system PrlF family antitoxin [Pseudomonadota bacterium]|nr:type II toxin-antitoxin system PrlF family antitoxin [Gammaproteobacteria bacterium]MDQ3583404.1 type II toxin-antitoxin system PrlF family antitoxin [Pseudomonadota bacterium]